MKFISITPENISDYEDLITRQNMRAFVKMYSPICWHCQQMQDAWNQLEVDKELNNMDIAIIEVRNDTLDLIKHESVKNINGFPTIRVIINGKIKKEYNGDRSIKDMTNFIKDNLKSKIKHSKKQMGGKKTKRTMRKLTRKSFRKSLKKSSHK